MHAKPQADYGAVATGGAAVLFVRFSSSRHWDSGRKVKTDFSRVVFPVAGYGAAAVNDDATRRISLVYPLLGCRAISSLPSPSTLYPTSAALFYLFLPSSLSLHPVRRFAYSDGVLPAFAVNAASGRGNFSTSSLSVNAQPCEPTRFVLLFYDLTIVRCCFRLRMLRNGAGSC